LLHILEHGGLKGTNRFEGKKKVMKFLGKKRKIPEGEYGVAISQKTRIVYFREKIEERGIGNLLRIYPAVPYHPMVPVCYLQFCIENDKAKIYGFNYLQKLIHTVP
jgi:hypothetical protein